MKAVTRRNRKRAREATIGMGLPPLTHHIDRDDLIDPANWPRIVDLVRRLPTLPDDPDETTGPEPLL